MAPSSLFSLEALVQTLRSRELWVEGSLSGSVTHLISDSRKLSKLSSDDRALYFARKGPTTDGHDYLESVARHSQVVGVVVERVVPGLKIDKPQLMVKNSTHAMALAVKNQAGDPTASSFCLAVTGTNGKTTTTYLTQAILQSLGHRVARLGTIEMQFEDEKIPSELTTPDFSELQHIFSRFQKRGADAFAFEASSHALDQHRLLGIELDVAMFTNLTPEHLDYHRTMEEYFLSKKRLFSELLFNSQKKKRLAIFPLDGAFGNRLNDELSSLDAIDRVTWSTKNAEADLFVVKSETSLAGTRLVVRYRGKNLVFESPLVGQYNIDNLLGAIALGAWKGATESQIQSALLSVPAIPGRLERVLPHENVFVDYAHTPDALENVLLTLRKLCSGKLRVVFGCGGERDRSKRSLMGGIAELYADEIVVTSDNPRTEDPEAIIADILKGLQRLKPTLVQPDRRLAIEQALQGRASSDVILIAGKGHETYQILGDKKLPFDDREVARTYLMKRK